MYATWLPLPVVTTLNVPGSVVALVGVPLPVDSKGGHAFYSNMALPSGGRLYADVTTGYGPECFTIPGKPSAGPYKIFIHYYSRGPMGYGMGKVEIVRHDGKGGLTFDERPYVVMTDRAFVNLGAVGGPLTGK